ncbi:HNH endonuclease [Paenibacillus aurantiacus]|uniref:HNH endonuclease n=1 Tax=Paenibacillus aurantiacus TaxID=1936118 RepID=A0ABV5L097_9BACL
MSSDRPRVPLPVARSLRQEAGFGCACCGNPFVEYHHIVPYAVDQHFREADMLALCPYCHHAANIGAMTEHTQREHKRNPYNLKNGRATGQLWVNQSVCTVKLGSLVFSNNGRILEINGEPIISIEACEDGRVELSLTLYDEQDNLILQIVKNEWIHGDVGVWDFEYGFNKLTLRTKHRSIDLHIDASNPGSPIYIRADLWRLGKAVRVNKQGVYIDRSLKERPSISGISFDRMYMKLDFINDIYGLEVDI